MTHKWIFLTSSSGIFAVSEYEWCMRCGAIKVAREVRTFNKQPPPHETYYHVRGKSRDYKREPKCKP